MANEDYRQDQQVPESHKTRFIDIGGGVFAKLFAVVLQAGTAVLGAVKDAGFNETTVLKVAHGDASGAGVTVADNVAAKKLVLVDLVINTAAACEVSITEESGGTLLGPFLMPANGFLQLTTRSTPMVKATTANKKLLAVSSTADHVTVMTWTYSEA